MELAMDLGGKNGVGKGKLNRNPKNPNKYQEKNFPWKYLGKADEWRLKYGKGNVWVLH